jgi:hypothetical protein
VKNNNDVLFEIAKTSGQVSVKNKLVVSQVDLLEEINTLKTKVAQLMSQTPAPVPAPVIPIQTFVHWGNRGRFGVVFVMQINVSL